MRIKFIMGNFAKFSWEEPTLYVINEISYFIDPNFYTETFFRCHIAGCNKVLRTKPSLTAHLSAHIDNEQVYECDICGKSYTRFIKLARHMTRHANPIRCNICSKP